MPLCLLRSNNARMFRYYAWFSTQRELFPFFYAILGGTRRYSAEDGRRGYGSFLALRLSLDRRRLCRLEWVLQRGIVERFQHDY